MHFLSQKPSNENKQQLYKIQKRPTSLFYHVLLINRTSVGTIISAENARAWVSMDFI